MIKKYHLLAIPLLFLTACDVFNIDGEQLIYPTGIEKLPMEELSERNSEYQAQNENICSTLNEYGFTGYSDVLFEGMETPCVNLTVPRIELNDPDTLEDLAKETLVLNSEYTGVMDLDALELIEMEPLRGCIVCEGPGIDSRTLQWKFVFNRQSIEGIEVHNSYITVVVDANGVNRIWGNWHQDFYLPQRANFLQDEILEVLDGQTIVWEENGSIIEHTIVSENLDVSERKMIVPFEDDNKLEMRVGWVIEIPSQEVEFGGWSVIGDMIDGRILIVDKLLKSNDFEVF